MPHAPANPTRLVSWSALSREPFRLFFPISVLVGLAGVSLWPLYFGGVVAFYPGQSHARLMAYGFFGGFILGFLGTAVPRMLSAKTFGPSEVGFLLVPYGAMVIAILAGKTALGDGLFLCVLLVFGVIMAVRAKNRRDIPPPGFVLVVLALACAGAGALLSLLLIDTEAAFFWVGLQHLLVYQGFMLLPILGVGAFLLPRFFGSESSHNFPESIKPPPGWTRKALVALGAGVLIIVSFCMEAAGWFRGGPMLRLLVTFFYLAREVPWWRGAKAPNAPASILRLALVLLLGGFLAIVVFPAYRIGLLHLTLIGGFAVITFTVATRVVFGHSGNSHRLSQPNRWLWVAVALMLLAMVTRVSGDFSAKILASHYSYGAAVWITGVLLWSVYVLPKVFVSDPGDLARV